MKKLLTVALMLTFANCAPAAGAAAQDASARQRDKARRVKIAAGERHPVRKEFEAVFAKQVADYRAQFEAVKRGERLKPDCAPDFVLRRPNGTTATCDEITAERQAKFERIKSLNYLVIELGDIVLDGDEAAIFTTQRFSRVVTGADGADHTVVTDGTVHKEFWVRTRDGWRSKGFVEVKQGTVTIDGRPLRPAAR